LPFEVIAKLKAEVDPKTTKEERTGAGRAAAQARGIRFGRPPALNADQMRLARRLLTEGMPAREIAATLGVHRATIYRLAAAEEH